MKSDLSFWRWFVFGIGGAAGYRRLIDIWLPVHIMARILLAVLVPQGLEDAAKAVLLPLAAILVGLSFAWAGNAQALLQTSEIEQLTQHREGGLTEYVFAYQTAILAILTTLVLWGLAGLGCYDEVWPTQAKSWVYLTVKWALFFSASVTLRECWHVVMSASWMLIVRRRIKEGRGDKEDLMSGEERPRDGGRR